MEYYVISPNVWNDGNFSQLLKDMYNNQMVLMGWGVDKPKGNQFANMKKGDCVIFAQRRDYKWHFYKNRSFLAKPDARMLLWRRYIRLCPVQREESECFSCKEEKAYSVWPCSDLSAHFCTN